MSRLIRTTTVTIWYKPKTICKAVLSQIRGYLFSILTYFHESLSPSWMTVERRHIIGFYKTEEGVKKHLCGLHWCLNRCFYRSKYKGKNSIASLMSSKRLPEGGYPEPTFPDNAESVNVGRMGL